MSAIYGGSPQGLSGAFFGGHRLGVLAETVPATGVDGPGYLFGGLTFPADTGKRVRGPITRWPTNGTLTVNADSSFTYSGTTDYALFLLIPDGSPSNANIGYGPGIGRIDLLVGGGSGALSGSLFGDDAAPGGSLGSQFGHAVLSGAVTLNDAAPAGGLISGVQFQSGAQRVWMAASTAAFSAPTLLDDMYVGQVDDLAFPCAKLLLPGETIASGEVTYWRTHGAMDASANEAVTLPSQVMGTDVVARLAVRKANVWYRIIGVVTLSSGRVLVGAADLFVKPL